MTVAEAATRAVRPVAGSISWPGARSPRRWRWRCDLDEGGVCVGLGGMAYPEAPRPGDRTAGNGDVAAGVEHHRGGSVGGEVVEGLSGGPALDQAGGVHSARHGPRSKAPAVSSRARSQRPRTSAMTAASPAGRRPGRREGHGSTMEVVPELPLRGSSRHPGNRKLRASPHVRRTLGERRARGLRQRTGQRRRRVEVGVVDLGTWIEPRIPGAAIA